MAVAGCTRQSSVLHPPAAGNVGLSVFRCAARAYSYPPSGTAGRCVTTGAFTSERWAGPVVPHAHTFSPLRHSGDLCWLRLCDGEASVTQIGGSETVEMVGRGRVCKVTGESKVSSVSQCWNAVWFGMAFGRAVRLGVSTC